MTLDSIIERLEKAEGGDRDMDEVISAALFPDNEFFQILDAPAGVGCMMYRHPNGQMSSALRVTSSVDAAIALAEKVLPGWAWKVGTCCVSDDAWVTPDFNSPIHGERLKREFPDLKAGSVFDTGVDIDLRPSGRPAIALCIAVLTALKAKQMGVGE